MTNVGFLTRQRRREQNRRAQQLFRQRKDTTMTRLEGEIEDLTTVNSELRATNEGQAREITRLRAQLDALSIPDCALSLSYEACCREILEDRRLR